jgi:hypothetical protein
VPRNKQTRVTLFFLRLSAGIGRHTYTALTSPKPLRQLRDIRRNPPRLTMGVKRKGPWRSLGDCCQGPRSVCVRGAEPLPCALADKNAVGHRLRAMGASFYLSRSPLAALPLRPLGQSPTKLLPAPPLAVPSATADTLTQRHERLIGT